LTVKRFRKTIRHPEEQGRMRKSGRNTIFYDQLFDLHGLTGDDAVFRLKNFISLHKNITVMINHGKGTGTLRTRVRAFLRQHSSVSSVRPGEELGLPEGDGVTIITI